MQPADVRPLRWLRAEGIAALLLSLVLYSQYGRGWLFFALFLLVPDLSMVGYLRGARLGALAYNVFHTYTSPLLLAAASLVLKHPLLLQISLIWGAHIGLDRALGYGLKLPSGFQDTHLGRIGRSREMPSEEAPASSRA